LYFDKGVLNIAMDDPIWPFAHKRGSVFLLHRTLVGVGDMTLNHVGFGERAFGAVAFALLLLAAPITAAIFLAQSL
jgi:hypothetical protein